MSQKDTRIRLIERVGRPGKVSGFNSAYAASSGDCLALLAGRRCLARGFFGRHGYQHCLPYVTDRSMSHILSCVLSLNDKRFDGLIIPRGDHGNRSGGTFLMSRSLADAVFSLLVLRW